MMVIKSLIGNLVCELQNLRRQIYQVGILDQVGLGVPVISVGNLTMGGTGKTPVVDWLLSQARDRHIKAGLVSRSYKAKAKDAVKVNANSSADFCGDEPVLLSQLHPESVVYVGDKKWQAATKLVAENKVDLLVVDDGFQHLTLKRDLEIVLIDASKGLKDLSPYPIGRARESLESLSGADVVLITKANKVSPEQVQEIKSSLPSQIPVYEVCFKSKLNLIDAQEDGQFTPVALISGVADNAAVLSDVRRLSNFQVLSYHFFDDHHVYSSEDIKKIVDEIRRLQIQKVICTAKDFVKLRSFDEIKDLLHVLHVELEFQQEPSKIYEFFNHTYQ